MKKKTIIITGAVIAGLLCCLLVIFAVYSLFNAQYNMATGVSSMINITVDKGQEKTKIGNLDGYDIYVKGLNVDECYFTTIDAETISLVDAINSGKVSIEDMTKKAFTTKDEGDKSVYFYENYKIEIEGKEALIGNLY